MIPFKPEPIWKMRQRYPKALEKIWVAEEDMEDHPSSHREHVFDFTNNLRLIISRDILKKNEGPKLHVSVSWFKNPHSTLEEQLEEIHKCFRLLDRRNVIWNLVGVSPKGIPHWILEDVN